MSHLSEYGPALLARGYSIVPIAPGTKYPRGIDDWQTIEATQKHLDAWITNGFAQGGVGVLTKNTPAVDIDVYDPAITQKLVDFCALQMGADVQRVGQAPKTLLVYRCETPFSKRTSTAYEDEEGRTHRIEVLGDGQQFVAYGTHKDTGCDYAFTAGDLATTDPDELPLLDHEDVDALFAYFDTLAREAGWAQKHEEKKAAPRGDVLSNAKPPLDISVAKIRDVLDLVADRADDYGDWTACGMALYHQFDGDHEGLALWDAWSAHSAKYREGDCAKKWPSFQANLKFTRPKTFATVLGWAKDVPEREKPPRSPVGTFLDRYVFIESGNLVADLTKPPHCAVTKLEEFRNATANVRHEVPAPTKADPDKTKWEPVHKAWLCHEARKSAQGVAYHPKKPFFFRDDAHDTIQWVNEFFMPSFREVADPQAHLGVFFEHMAYLFVEEGERETFIDWMAFNLQFPERRCKWTPLHVSRAHGTGRGWVVEVLGRLLGHHNCTKTKMATLAGEGSSGGFNDYLNKSLLCSVEEVREGTKRFGVSDKIRDILTENHLQVNVKYGGMKTQEVFTNFFFMSNHPDALVLGEEDRRINVFSGPDEPRELPYYERLYGWAEGGAGVAALHAWLMARDLSRFNWARSTDTPGRQRMIENNRTETEQAFIDFMEDPPFSVMTADKIMAVMVERSEDPMSSDLDMAQLRKLLQHKATPLGQIRLGGKGSKKVTAYRISADLSECEKSAREILAMQEI